MRASYPVVLCASITFLVCPLAYAQAALTVAIMQTWDYLTLLQGTAVMLLLDQTVDGEHSRLGQQVEFEVARNVEISNRILIRLVRWPWGRSRMPRTRDCWVTPDGSA